MDRDFRMRKQKTSRVIKKLEHFLGTPLPPKRKAKPLDMLVATVLSQNTNDKNSHRAYCSLRETFPAWSGVLAAPTGRIATAIRVGGMANQKSVRIKRILKTLYQRFGTLDLNFLRTKTDVEIADILLSLDGVGSKTVACVLLFSLGRNVFPVDTHVHRICERLGLSQDCKTPEKTYEWMKELVPAKKSYSFHTNLIRFGRQICRSDRPRCGECPLYTECRFIGKSRFRQMPSHPSINGKYDFMLLDHIHEGTGKVRKRR